MFVYLDPHSTSLNPFLWTRLRIQIISSSTCPSVSGWIQPTGGIGSRLEGIRGMRLGSVFPRFPPCGVAVSISTKGHTAFIRWRTSIRYSLWVVVTAPSLSSLRLRVVTLSDAGSLFPPNSAYIFVLVSCPQTAQLMLPSVFLMRHW